MMAVTIKQSRHSNKSTCGTIHLRGTGSHWCVGASVLPATGNTRELIFIIYCKPMKCLLRFCWWAIICINISNCLLESGGLSNRKRRIRATHKNSIYNHMVSHVNTLLIRAAALLERKSDVLGTCLVYHTATLLECRAGLVDGSIVPAELCLANRRTS